MTLFLVVFATLLIVVSIMAVGVIFADKPIKGSCGGLNALGFKEDCEICGGNRDKCEAVKLNDIDSEASPTQAQFQESAPLAYDAMKKVESGGKQANKRS